MTNYLSIVFVMMFLLLAIQPVNKREPIPTKFRMEDTTGEITISDLFE